MQASTADPAPQQATEQENRPENGRFHSRLSAALSNLALFLLVVAFAGVVVAEIVWFTATVAPPGVGALQGLLFAAFIGIFPISYLAYRFGREEAQRKRIKNDFRLLGLVKEEELEETVDELYRTVYSRWQYLTYLSLIVLVSLFIAGGYLRQDSLGNILVTDSILPARTMQLIFYAFLGAYVFAVQSIIRRYNTMDLQPQVYSATLVRMLVAIAITFAGVQLIEAAGGNLLSDDEAAAGASWAAVLAFVIGAFPSRGFQWFTRIAGKALTLPAVQSSERPLTHLIGMSTWHEARLQELGIDDAQNLATADMRRLLLMTQFDTQLIVHWIDQAILYTKIGPKIDRFRDAHIQTFFEFRQELDDVSEAVSLLDLDPSARETEQNNRLDRLALALGLSSSDELDRLANYENFPNYAYIKEYYTRVRDVAHLRAEEGMRNVLGRVFERNSVEAARRWLRHHPQDVNVILGLGKAYYKMGDYKMAADYYRQAARQSGDPGLQADAFAALSAIFNETGRHEEAIKSASKAIELFPAAIAAFNNRGVANLALGHLDQAFQDFDDALRLDDRHASAYSNRGLVYADRGRWDEALADFERAYLLGNRDDPHVWIRWGEGLVSRGELSGAAEKFSRAIRVAEADDTARLKAYLRRGFSYMQHGVGTHELARNDLETVRGDADQSRKEHAELAAAANNNLGLLAAWQGLYPAAIDYYQAALANAPGPQEPGGAGPRERVLPVSLEVDIRYNLAVAYAKEERLTDAVREFESILSLAPNSAEAQEARRWLQQQPALAPTPARADGDVPRETVTEVETDNG